MHNVRLLIDKFVSPMVAFTKDATNKFLKSTGWDYLFEDRPIDPACFNKTPDHILLKTDPRFQYLRDLEDKWCRRWWNGYRTSDETKSEMDLWLRGKHPSQSK